MCVRLDDLNHSRACPTSTPSSGCRVPNTRHRVTTAPTENQDLLFSISAPATSASIHMKGRRGKQGPNQVTDLKAVLLREAPFSRSTSSCRTKATEPKQPRRYNGSRGQIWSLHTNRFVIPTHAQALLSLSLAPSETPANLRKGGASALSGANKKHRQVLISGHRPKQKAHIQQDR